MLELLVSPPGTGKTTHCIELFRDQILKSKGGIDSRSFFILPSREHAERIQNLILKKEVTGLFNAHILTINDFTAKLLGGFSGAAATDTLRRNLIKRILQDPDLLAGGENSKGLQYFGKVAELGGFYHLLADTIKEFKSGLLTISEFESLAQALLKKGVFRSKFRDFSIVLKKYEAALKELGMKEPEDDIASLLKEGGVSGRSVDLVIFDGFYHFTRAQRSLIGAVSRWSGHTIVTLTLPQVEADRKSLFEYPLHTKRFLVEMGFRPKQGSFGDNLRTAEPDLRHLERALFSKEPNVCPQSPSNISLLEAPTVREEIQMIARQIKKLYRETDIHYSDICVVLRTIADYESIIHSVFMEFDIPVNIHERKKLIEQGFAVTLFRFLDLLRNDWRREDLLYFLKSSYLRHQIKPEDALELEALAVGRNISGERSKWFALLDASDVTQGAKDALKWVSDWEKKFLNARSLKEFSGHLDVFMSQCGMLKPDEAAASGDANEKSDQQAAKTIDTLLKNARRDYDAQGGRPFVVLPFIEELQEAMEAALFSLKPSGKNRVQVYDVVMALAKEYKAVFIAGLLEKRFPQAVSEDPLFKDDERRVINRKETVLEERLWRVAGERYFFYMACTRAKEKLYLSYPLYDAEARPSLPSFFVDEVKKCFKPGSLSVLRKDLNERLPKSDEWESEAGVTRDLSESLFQEEKEGDDSCFITNPAMIEALNEWIAKDYFKEIVRNGLSDDEAAIRDERIKKSFAGLRGPFSATRLETYATCAFKYFAQRILRLKEPLEGKESMEMGNLLHKVLEEFYKDLPQKKRENKSFFQDLEKAERALHERIEELMPQSLFGREPLYRQKIYSAWMRAALSLFVATEREALKDRELVPAYFELEFGGSKDKGKGDRLDCLKIPSEGGDILIEGKIDRVDVIKNQNKALVVDYKLSEHPGSERLRANAIRGMELQIPLYLLAVERLLNMEALGGELHSLKKGKKSGLYRESAAQVLGLKDKEACSDEEFKAILAGTERFVTEYVRRLRSADISVRSKTCDHCPYSAVCRFEKWRLIYLQEAAPEEGPDE